MSTLKKLESQSFDITVNTAETPVLVDFYADWCGPCKALAPVVETLAEERSDRLSVAKVDIDDNPDLAVRFGIQSIPTLVVFQAGNAIGKITGLVSKAELERQLDALLAQEKPVAI